jgi:hypothetical protein
VTHVVQPRRGMQPGIASEALESVSERVRMQEEAIAALAHQRRRCPLLIERIFPPSSEQPSPLELLSAMSADALQHEGRQLDHPASPLGLERCERDRAGLGATWHPLDTAADADDAGPQIHIFPGKAEGLRAARPARRAKKDRYLPDSAR